MTDEDGKWFLKLPAMHAGGPYHLQIRSSLDSVFFDDILVGDVWFYSGQSNMHHPISGWDWIPHSEIAHAAVALKDTTYPEVRLFKVPLYPSPQPLDNLIGGQWKKLGAESLSEFAATSWFFAKILNQRLDIPIGIIQSSWGGTSILTWSDLKELQGFKDSLSLERSHVDRYDPETWNHMIQKTIDQNIKRRNQISYAKPRVKIKVLHSDRNDTLWSKIDLATVDKNTRVIWMRNSVNIPKVSLGDSMILSLGFLNRQSHVFWNGRLLGYFQYPAPVRIRIPSEWIMKGENTLIVRLANPWQKPVLLGEDELFYLQDSRENIHIPLYQEWNFAENLQDIISAKPSYISYLGFLYNGMIAPVIPYGIRGFIWDQGGADATRPVLYARLFQSLIKDWRRKWGDDRLPFLFIQNTDTYSGHDRSKRFFVRSYLREAQERALQLPETGMVVSIDIGDPYDVHPKNKQEFGRRLALQALRKVYGKNVISDGPFYISHYIEGDTIVIQLKNEAGLIANGITGENNGFELVGEDGTIYIIKAWLDGNTVFLTSPNLSISKELRYAWGNYPVSSIFNDEGLPLAPFRIRIPRIKNH